jgi:hypothetical protein
MLEHLTTIEDKAGSSYTKYHLVVCVFPDARLHGVNAFSIFFLSVVLLY